MPEYSLYWGETHDNTYQFPNHTAGAAPPHIATALERAATHLDFYAAAYYTAESEAFQEGGHVSESKRSPRLILEGWKPRERLDAEWTEVQEATRVYNEPGVFVTFPGYEWQGDGTSGDHNVYAREEGLPLFRVDTIAELYDRLRGREALAIPHHVAYPPGIRGRDWSVYDPDLSPFCEIYSIHGCSEVDDEWVPMRQNSHMGPAVHAGTWQAALDRGHRLGCICSTDNWGQMPGHFGRGRAAVWATELTRPALWEAFRARRVYGVTGDRIRLDFQVDGVPMGAVVRGGSKREIRVHVTGAYALDRVELLRNGRVIATHCHQGGWDLPGPQERRRFKLRVEAGWGPRPGELALPDQNWTGELEIAGGALLDWEPCWIAPDQTPATLHGNRATFGFRTSHAQLQEPMQNADVFEFEADLHSLVRLRMNELEMTATVAELAAGSRELWFRDESIRLLHERAGIPPGSPERDSTYHLVAHKVKVHRLFPESAYTTECAWDDDEPLTGVTNYRIRVEQRNGQRAWSSPVWVHP